MLIHSTVEKRAKRTPDYNVETTHLNTEQVKVCYSDKFAIQIPSVYVFLAKWYKLTPWELTASGDWLREHKY